MADRPRALFAMRSEHLSSIFPPRLMRRLRELADIDDAVVAERFDDPRIGPALSAVDVLITGWGCPPIDASVLDSAPRLRTVLHSAGTVKAHITEACWRRGLAVSSAADANAVPVAEYTLGAILLAGKGAFQLREQYRDKRGYVLGHVHPEVGNFGLRVGVIGASRVGRRVLGLLRPFDIEVLLHDPYVDDATAADLGATLVDLDGLLSGSDIVSLHAPDIPETHRLLSADRLARMRDGAVLINTSRGNLVDTAALTAELADGRLSAILDVTTPEPLSTDSPLFDMPNVFLTPHIAGSQGNELERMGRSVVCELERLVDGRPLAYRVHHTHLDRQA